MTVGQHFAFGIQSVGDYSYSTRRLSLAFTAALSLYLASGVAMLAISLILTAYIQRPTGSTASAAPTGTSAEALIAATVLALRPVDLNHGIVTAALIFLSVILAVPGTLTKSRGLLKASSCVTLVSIVSILAIGLEVWFFTLIERQEYATLWLAQGDRNTALVQDKFGCCSYLSPALLQSLSLSSPSSPSSASATLNTTYTFVTSAACPDAQTALAKPGCEQPLAAFADALLNHLFTSLFGLSGIALLALLSCLVLVKRITELERFRNIDVKKSVL